MFPPMNTIIGSTGGGSIDYPPIDLSNFYRKDQDVVINNPNVQLGLYVKNPTNITNSNEIVNKQYCDINSTVQNSAMIPFFQDIDPVTLVSVGIYQSTTRPLQYITGGTQFSIYNVTANIQRVKIPDFII